MLIVLAPETSQTLGAFLLRSILGCVRSHPLGPRPTESFNPSTKLSPTLHAGHALALAFPLIAKTIGLILRITSVQRFSGLSQLLFWQCLELCSLT